MLSDVSLPPELTLWRRGKVREVYAHGADQLLLVASDRISAFDCILPTPIPGKGRILTEISAFWFRHFADLPHQLITTDPDQMPPAIREFARAQEGRATLAKRTEPLPVECVVRGYLAGSGWKDYRSTGKVGGLILPAGLQLASELPEPIFSPSTKATEGHDQNIDWEECRRILGADLAEQVRAVSLRLYREARQYAAERGLIIADTKFEFGTMDGKLLLIDEVITPDSSRFWQADQWQPGQNPPSFDKQFVRDYLETLDWDKTDPAPALPDAIVAKTASKYREAYERLTR